jgi:hypothetical protein
MKLHELRSWILRASFADDKDIEINISGTDHDEVYDISSLDINKDGVIIHTSFKRYD